MKYLKFFISYCIASLLMYFLVSFVIYDFFLSDFFDGNERLFQILFPSVLITLGNWATFFFRYSYARDGFELFTIGSALFLPLVFLFLEKRKWWYLIVAGIVWLSMGFFMYILEAYGA